MNLPDLESLDAIVAGTAQQELIPGFGSMEYEFKEDGSIITRYDTAMQAALQIALGQAWPEYPVLGEEMDERAQRSVLENDTGYWCIDPLDGTNNYATGMPFFAVSIALVIDGRVELGYIHDPVRGESFSAIRGQGAFLDGEPLRPNIVPVTDDKVIAEIDMKRLPRDLVTRLIDSPPYGSQRNIGTCALDWCWLAAGRYNVYLHGAQKLWDLAAGQLIVAEAGGYSCALDGEPVFRNRLEARSALASLDPDLFRKWKSWIGVPTI